MFRPYLAILRWLALNTWEWPSKAEICSEGEGEKKDNLIYIVLHRDGDSDIVCNVVQQDA
jgi:hypothetical protein